MTDWQTDEKLNQCKENHIFTWFTCALNLVLQQEHVWDWSVMSQSDEGGTAISLCVGGLVGQVTDSRRALVNWNKCPPEKTQHKCCRANYVQSFRSHLPVSPSNACGWAETQRNSHIKATEGIVCIQYMYTQIFSRICLLFHTPFIFHGNQVRGRLPQTGSIKALSYICFRFCSADGRTQICKASQCQAIQGKGHLNPLSSNSIHLCNSRNQEE